MPDFKSSSRRNFIKGVSVLSAVSIIPGSLNGFPLKAETDRGDHFTFLFQGDSITDGNRSRNQDWNHVLGHGYAYLIASRLLYQQPRKDFHFFNRGVSGNKLLDLSQRWQEDALALKPDLISILIGVNDTTSAVFGNNNLNIEAFESNYRALLKQTKEALPDVKLVIMEPFILPVGKVKENWNAYSREISGRQHVARQIAEEFNAIFVPLQNLFNKAAENSPDYWIWDGVHPMPNGHELIAREWLKRVSEKLKFIKV